ncbi:NAD-dependent epimerase/dehydratase family protein [Sediminibacterium sp.]|uniref:NAD-dependent epimerase/dehydratase family protein n=1 Tax=Sediminibacterium sp. TaxID=1917865 RepID=UPI0025FDD532|nr:NAD-dependent epimerase/dehydratase family protein [Sediminibacterium sp.]
MKILVTGATGFIGNYVVNELVFNGDEVIVLGRDIEKASHFNWFKKVMFIHYEFGEIISEEIFEKIKGVDKLINLSWSGLPNYNSIEHIENNLLQQYYFIKQLVLFNIRDITVTGTCFEYGNVNGPLDSRMQSNPTNPYALAKDTLRKMLQFLQKEQDFNLKWVRLFYMYGKGQSKHSILSQLDNAIDGGLTEFNMSGGEQLRDYLPIESVTKDLIRFAKMDSNLGVVNLASGIPISIRKLVENHLREKNKTIKLNFGFYPYPNYEPMAFWGVPFAKDSD